MKRSLLISCATLIAIFLGPSIYKTIAPNKTLREKLVGRWKIDFDRSAQWTTNNRKSKDLANAAKSGIVSNLIYQNDGKHCAETKTIDQIHERHGKWHEIKQEGKTIFIQIIHDDGEKEELQITFLNDNLVKIVDPRKTIVVASERIQE